MKPYFEEAYLWRTVSQRIGRGDFHPQHVHKELVWNDLFHSFPKYFVVVLGKGSAKIMPGLRLFRADAACYSATCSILAKKTLRHFKTPEFLVVRQFFLFVFPTRGSGTPQKTSDRKPSVQGSYWAIGMEVVWAASRACQCLRFATLPGRFGRPCCCKSQVKNKSIVGLDCCFFK